MQLKCYSLFNKTIFRNIYRNYVSLVSVNVNSFKSVKVKTRDGFDSAEDVKLTLLDGKKKKVDPKNVNSLNIVITKDSYKFDCTEAHDFSATLELPVYSTEVEIEVSAEKSNVEVESIQCKRLGIDVKSGNISLKAIKSHVTKVDIGQGNILSKGQLLGKDVHLISKNGEISIAKAQGEKLEVEAATIKVGSCYSKISNFTTTNEAILKNVHGKSSMKSTGKTFRLTVFSGTLNAQLDNEKIDFQLSNLTGENLISSINPNANIKIGIGPDIIGLSNFDITSNCSIDNYVSELVSCQRKKHFEVKKESPNRKNRLKVSVQNGKSLELNTMSWIEFLRTV